MSNSEQTLVQRLSMLAQEVASTDQPIYGVENFRTDVMYDTVANGILEMYLSADKEAREEVMLMLAALIHSQVENMILNIQLMEKS